MDEEKPIWQSKKLLVVIIGIVAVLAIFLGGTAIGLDEEQKAQAVGALKWFVGLFLAGHTISNATANLAQGKVAAEVIEKEEVSS